MSVHKRKSKTAPHKAILLLTIMDMIETGEISAPFIPITDGLLENFIRIWNTCVPPHCGFHPKMAYPFFHLSSSPFWELVKTSAYKGQNEYSSMKALERDFSGAIIDVGLFRMMKDPVGREELRVLLKSTYLNDSNSAPASNGLGMALLAALIFAVA